jgi:mannose-6-phosphate isomerase-like protein (cupin superfamily)
MKYAKAWGTTEPIIVLPGMEVHRIEIKAGGYCSKHYHQHKHNLFFVESGALDVVVRREPERIEDRTRLIRGDKFTVVPTDVHWFEAVSDVVAYEVYWCDANIGEDIFRETVGGIR